MKIKSINKNKIPPLEYEGYLWLSNAKEPIVFDAKNITGDDLEELPFVIEGLLYAAKENISIRITNIDGEYRIAKMTLSEEKLLEIQEYTLNKNKFGSKGAIKIYQHYEEKADPVMRDDWMVLQPTWFAFVGFKN
jgi:CRISPR type III-associated protein (TIGR04423 family)